MEVLSRTQSEGILSIHFRADADEFRLALTDICGPESFSACRPEEFPAAKCHDAALYLAQQHLRTSQLLLADIPEVLIEDGPNEQGITFFLTVPLYPEVHLGQYKGISVAFQEDQEALADSILMAAIDAMRAEVPEKLLEKKQASIEAMERGMIAQESYYILLADVLAILESSCRKLGVSRPPQHSLAEAVDLMMCFMSQSPEEQTIDSFRALIRKNLLRLCDVPPAFDEEIDHIIALRQKKVREQLEEERSDELLEVYLRSRDLSMKDWHLETLDRADYMVRLDLLLNAVAVAEHLQVSDDEITAAHSRQPEIDFDTLSWQLLQGKARKLILDSAIILR